MKVYSELERLELTGIVDVRVAPGINGSQHLRGRFDSGMFVRGRFEDSVLVGFTVDNETYIYSRFIPMKFDVIAWKRVGPGVEDWKTVDWTPQF